MQCPQCWRGVKPTREKTCPECGALVEITKDEDGRETVTHLAIGEITRDKDGREVLTHVPITVKRAPKVKSVPIKSAAKAEAKA